MRRAAAARSANEREAARISATQDDSALKGASYSGPSENAGTGGASPTVIGGQNARAGKQPVRIIRRTTTPETQAPTRSFSEVEAAPDQAKRVPYRKANSLDPYANVGRNDPCPCGSGKKFKNCHGRPGRR